MRILPLLAALVLFQSSWQSPATAQPAARQFSKQPIVVMYLKGVTAARMVEYTKELSQKLQVGNAALKQISSQPVQEMSTQAEQPVVGQMTFLVQGLVPSFGSVTFQQVIDAAEAERMMKARSKQMGPDSSLTNDAGNYTLVNSWTWKSELQEGQEPQPDQQFPNTPLKRTSTVIEEDGKRYQEFTQTYTQYYRYQDQFLYESSQADLFEMSLPGTDEILSGVDNSSDMGARIYMDRVPMGIKQLGWNMLNSTVGAQLQQRDDEDLTDHELRQFSGEYGLSVVRTLLFDVDLGDGWGRFASDGLPLKGQFLLRARRNSSFTKWLDDLSSTRSRMAPLLRDDSAATLHLCMNLPEEARNILPAAGRWLEKMVAQSSRANADMIAAIGGISESVTGISEHGNIELLVKIGWSEPSGGVIYGGLQVDDHPQLLHNLLQLVNSSNPPPQFENMFSMVEKDGRPMIQVLLPPTPDDVPVKISHLYIAHENACLWFSAGGENAWHMVHQAIERCGQSGRAVKTRLLTAAVDIEKWRSYPQDDPTGITALPHWVDTNSMVFAQLGPVGAGSNAKQTPLMDRVFALGGRQQGQFTLDVDESGLLAEAELGKALANYYAVRILDMVDQQVARQQQALRETEERVQELKDAATPQPVQTSKSSD
jgi:hypothetical protein